MWIVRILLFAAASLVAACAVQSGDANGVTIEHASNQFGAAQWTAERHCAQFGKRAVLARKGPRSSNGIIPQTNVAEFDCVQ